MRVISGTAKGCPLKAMPGTTTRPTTDKVKEALFSRIGPYFSGGLALDLFAGTGGLGIEALSRGMDKAIFIDKDRHSIATVKHNLQAARLEQRAEWYCNDAQRAIKALAKRQLQFDLVFLDPPYRLHLYEAIMTQLCEAGLLTADAIIVAESSAELELPETIGSLQCGKAAVYGDIAVTIYRMGQAPLSGASEGRGEQANGDTA